MEERQKGPRWKSQGSVEIEDVQFINGDQTEVDEYLLSINV
jgi:hypothetical protein